MDTTAHVPKIEPAANGTSDFADINLDDSVPKIDLSFGPMEIKDSSGFGSFGGWGGGGGGGTAWNTGSNWNFSGADTATTDIADSFARATKESTTDTIDSNTWSFGGNKKNQKKKTTTGGFEAFNFGALDEEKEDEKAKVDQLGGNDDCETFTAAGKKEKVSKKKGTFDDTSNNPDPNTIGTALADPELAAADSWNTWGVSSAKKKKGKKGEEEMAPLPHPVAVQHVSSEPAIDEWGGFGNKKGGKKGKKIVEVDEPTVVAVPEGEPEPDAAWGTIGKKEKKKARKEAEKIEEPAVTMIPEVEPEVDIGKSSSSKKEKRKGGKKEPEKVEESTTTAFPEPEADPNLNFGPWGKSDDKKGKKGKKEPEKVEEPTITAFPDAEPGLDFGFTSLGRKDDKKGKQGKKGDQSGETAFTAIPEVEPEADIGWGSFAKKDAKKKSKKDIDKTEEPTAKEPEPEPIHDWSPTGTKKGKDMKKVKKLNMWDQPEDEENEVVEEMPDPEIDTTWGAFGPNKDRKKGKKGGVEEPKPIEAKPVVEEKPALSRTGSTKGKKGKKNLVSEVQEDPVPTIESKFATDAAILAADDDWASGFGSDKKKDKKNRGNSLASTGSKGDEGPPPPPPVPDVPGAFSFDDWGTGQNDKDKDKEKKGKKNKVAVPHFVPAQEPEEKKDIVEDDTANWANLSAKEKRKKEGERKKKDKEAKEVKEREDAEEQKRNEREEAEENEWRDMEAAEEKERKEKEEAEEKEREENQKKGKDKAKGKLSKKGKMTTSPEASKTKNLLADSIPDDIPAVEGDTWGSTWGAGAIKTEPKKGGKKEMPWEMTPPRAPTPPAQGLTPEPEEDSGEELVDDNWGDYAPAETTTKGKKDAKKDAKEDLKAGKKGVKDKKDASKEETAARAAKSSWGNVGTTPASKSKMSAKDKDKAAKEAKAKEEEEEEEEKEKEEEYDYDDYDDYNDDEEMMKDAEPEVDMNTNNNVAFSPWASSPLKKTAGKKGADETWGKKEIGAKDLTNQKSTGTKQVSNEPEAMDKDDQQPWTSQPSKSFKSAAAMSTSKSTTKTSSVLQRVKEIEREKNTKASLSAPPDPDPEPTSILDNISKAGPSSKTKDVAPSKSAPSKAKTFSPASKAKKKASEEEAVPGSFPGEGMEDDFNNLDEILDDEPPLEKKESKKSAKPTKDSKLTAKTRDTPEPKEPPTPPPETKEEKPAKKERPRIAKEGGASSWGLWGAAPPKKKESKSKDDADVSSPPKKEKVTAAGFTRSKSTRTAKEKDKVTVKSDSKSSDSDKPKKTESRPPKSRGSSFGALFGPPVRTKSVRKNSTAASGPKSSSSRRQSVDVDATGLPSPPAEEAPQMASKAAKMMGTAKLDRKASTRGKQTASGENDAAMFEKSLETADGGDLAVPDPYAIDSDDIDMVNDLDGALPEGKKTTATKDTGSKSKSRGMDVELGSSIKKDLPDRSKSKRDPKTEPSSSKKKSKVENDLDDDVVMVDAGSSGDAGVEPGPDDMQFITKPKGLQRSATSSKRADSKSVGLGGGLFGAFRKNRRAPEVNRLTKSKATVEDEEIAPRKRTVTGGDDSAKRPRRDERRKSEKVDRAAEGYVYDTARDVGAAAEVEDADARREKRRAKRAEDDRIAKEQREDALRYEADRRAKRREADKAKLKDDRDKRARKDEEAEARRLEDKEDRRAAREARRREEEANRALEDDILKPRSKRRDTEKEAPAASSSRPRTSDRRRSHMDKATERPKSSRRKSTMAPVDDYFDPRNSRPINENDPYGGNDHTASWVKSQVSEPPEPPPLEPTIMEQAPDYRSKGAADLMEDEYARRASHKKPKRSSRMYTDPLGDEQEERRRRRKEKEVRSSEGSGAEERYGGLGSMNRRQSDLGGVKLGAGTKTFDGKTGQGKRSSWFHKVTGGF